MPFYTDILPKSIELFVSKNGNRLGRTESECDHRLRIKAEYQGDNRSLYGNRAAPDQTCGG